MKNLFLTAVFLLSAFCVNAQKELSVANQYPGDEKAQGVYQTAVEKQAHSSAVRTTWLANKPNSNWFISLEGGVSQLFDERYSDYPFEKNIKPTGGIALGKWFSPVWGLRISASGGKLAGWNQDPAGIWYVGQDHQVAHQSGSYVKGVPADITARYLSAPDKDGDVYNKFSYANATADFLLNLKNLFLPYNPKGFFNPVLYGGVGFVQTFGKHFDPFNTVKEGQNVVGVGNVAVKGGLQFNFRLCDSWNLYLEAEGLLVPETFDRYVGGSKTYEGVASAKLGLTYRFNFRHFVKAPLYDQSEIDALNREINELRNRPQVVCPPVVVCPDPQPVVVEKPKETGELDPVFFLLDSHVVRDNQLVNVAKAAEYLISHPAAKLELASYADKKTGNPRYNLQLSKKRTDAVANVLVSKFGIDKKRLTLKHYGDTVQPFAENDWNRVTLFIK
ncbi:membrane protein [Bacteroidia bacterium]|nr:membrane protein [Bacteroidia bacterium]GHT46492.1 membrane protein [Bacteroidia bacterium]